MQSTRFAVVECQLHNGVQEVLNICHGTQLSIGQNYAPECKNIVSGIKAPECGPICGRYCLKNSNKGVVNVCTSM